MRSLAVLLYVFVVLAALLANDEDIKASKKMTFDYLSLNLIQYEAATRRLLRQKETTDSEERVLPFPLPMVALTNWVKSLTSKIEYGVQAHYWLWMKQPADDIFKRLKLDTGLDNFLANPKFYAWATYMDLLKKKNPNIELSIVGVLAKTYGHLALARALERALNVEGQWNMAARLTKEQRQNWKGAKKSADDIFTLLKLDKVGGNIFVNAQLNTWYNYVSMIKKEDAKMDMAAVLSAHYSDEALSKIFLPATPRFPRMRFIRVKLETAVGLYRLLSPEECFKVLKLDTDITSPYFATWIRFLMEYNKRNPGKETTVFKTFTKLYGDKARSKITEAVEKLKN